VDDDHCAVVCYQGGQLEPVGRMVRAEDQRHAGVLVHSSRVVPDIGWVGQGVSYVVVGDLMGMCGPINGRYCDNGPSCPSVGVPEADPEIRRLRRPPPQP